MKISRRSVLHISGLVAAALALTGCSAAGSAALGGKLPGLLKGLAKKGETAASLEAASDMAVTPPPSENGRRLRIYYATQQKTNPPTFILFVNDRELLHFSYERYLENHLRKTFPFAGTPIRILARERNEKEEK